MKASCRELLRLNATVEQYAIDKKSNANQILSERCFFFYARPKFLTAADKYFIELMLDYSGRMKEHWDIFGIGSPFL